MSEFIVWRHLCFKRKMNAHNSQKSDLYRARPCLPTCATSNRSLPNGFSRYRFLTLYSSAENNALARSEYNIFYWFILIGSCVQTRRTENDLSTYIIVHPSLFWSCILWLLWSFINCNLCWTSRLAICLCAIKLEKYGNRYSDNVGKELEAIR